MLNIGEEAKEERKKEKLSKIITRVMQRYFSFELGSFFCSIVSKKR